MKLLRMLKLLIQLLLIIGVLLALGWQFLWPAENTVPKPLTLTEKNLKFEVQTEIQTKIQEAQGQEIELIVDLEDDQKGIREALEKKYKVKMTLNSPHAEDDQLYIIRVQQSSVEFLMTHLQKEKGVESVEINRQVQAFGTEPNDPLYIFQWHFDQVQAEDAWSLSTGKGVKIAVIDTGVSYKSIRDLEHTEICEGYDFVDKDKEPFDEHGHGSHVAGTIAQTTHNGYGVAGLAYGSCIMPLRVLNKNGVGRFSDVADAIDYAADQGAQVINMSLGGPWPSLSIKRAIESAYQKGVVIVAAAGNSHSPLPSYPAAYPEVISVTATRFDKTPTFYTNYGSTVDIAAPGGDTRVDQNGDGKPDGVLQETLSTTGKGTVFALYMGTSMASPHVAAAVALLIEAGITNPQKIKSILKDSVQKPAHWDKRYGVGILDVEAALKLAKKTQWFAHLLGGLLVLLWNLFSLQRKDLLEGHPHKSMSLWMGWSVGIGFFLWLPYLLGPLPKPWMEVWLQRLVLPFSQWDHLIFGPGAWSVLGSSFLIPWVLALLFLQWKSIRLWIAGLTLGTVGVFLSEALMQWNDIAWIPGIASIWDGLWLFANALLLILLGRLLLTRA